MKLLILTQKVALKDPILGFFHRWIEEFAKNFEKVTVVCLERGEYNLPGIEVLSLGKEERKSKAEYLSKFYRDIWQERSNYDAVFVHMNQEYVLLGWVLWRLMGKKIYLWSNHAEGSILTRMAVWFSNKVFYTSPQSFTARFAKAVQMPVGVDTDFFKPNPSVDRISNSILFLGRIAPVKKVIEFVEWFNTLDQKFIATVAGSALLQDSEYEKKVKEITSPRIKFVGSVNHEQALELYQTHEIYVNKTPVGSFDKTIVEAVACGMKILVDNEAVKDLKPEDHSLKKLIGKLTEEIK